MNEIISTSQNMYLLYEQRSPTSFTRKCIDNTITGCNKCLGYCQYDMHPGFLTEKLIKEHDCIGKSCFYFIEKPKRQKSKPLTKYDQSESILAQLQKIITNDFVKVVKVKYSSFNNYTAYYVTISNELNFNDYLEQVQNHYNVNLNFVRLNYDFDTCVSILCA